MPSVVQASKTRRGSFIFRNSKGQFAKKPSTKPELINQKLWNEYLKYRADRSLKESIIKNDFGIKPKLTTFKKQLRKNPDWYTKQKEQTSIRKVPKDMLRSYLRYQITLMKYDPEVDETPEILFIQGVIVGDGFISLKALASMESGRSKHNNITINTNMNLSQGVSLAKEYLKNGFHIEFTSATYKVYHRVSKVNYRLIRFNPLKRRY